MDITITINTDNAAFEGAEVEEVSRILSEIAWKIEDDASIDDMSIRDINGNTVGHLTI
ncbi:hypothetical protein KAR91_53040 [Candidatus Pacearchaeota archaeon]|nr:hypothetical protein [Candidatus Pacearchaeota archaeon]